MNSESPSVKVLCIGACACVAYSPVYLPEWQWW